MRRFVFAIFLLVSCSACVTRQRYESFTVPTPIAQNEFLILGFVGGRVSWNNDKEGVRKLALRLRAMSLPGVHIETIENQKRHLAIQLVQRALDQNRDGLLQDSERESSQLILYGQSFGGAAVVKLAKQLKALDIPVLLMIQIDSIGKHDHVVPSNVRNAANLYQRNGIVIRGEAAIRASDPARTKIIGNFKFDYSNSKIDISHVPWWKKFFRTAHTRMNFDPEVWKKVESLILGVIRR